MEPSAFAEIVAWVLAHGYPLMFLAMLVEGPFVTSAAGFAAALGYFNIWIVLVLSFFGDFVSDIVLYGVGYAGRFGIVERYGRFLGVTPAQIEKAEAHVRAHAVKELVIMKFLPVVPTVGLIAAGAARMPFRKFAIVAALVIVPRTLLFGGLGYYFGHIYDAVARYVNNLQYSLLILAVGGTLAYLAYRKIGRRLARRVDPVPNNADRDILR